MTRYEMKIANINRTLIKFIVNLLTHTIWTVIVTIFYRQLVTKTFNSLVTIRGQYYYWNCKQSTESVYQWNSIVIAETRWQYDQVRLQGERCHFLNWCPNTKTALDHISSEISFKYFYQCVSGWHLTTEVKRMFFSDVTTNDFRQQFQPDNNVIDPCGEGCQLRLGLERSTWCADKIAKISRRTNFCNRGGLLVCCY